MGRRWSRIKRLAVKKISAIRAVRARVDRAVAWEAKEMRGTSLAPLCVTVALGVGAPSHADEIQAADGILNFVSNGCLNSIVSGSPVSVFARQQRAEIAAEEFARTLLGTGEGTVYLKAHPLYPLVIVERSGGPCTVNARVPGDLTAEIEAVDDFLAGPGGGFYVARVFEEAAGTAGWTTHRVYLGQRRGKKITLLFSTTPGAETIDQIMFAAAETRP